MTNTKSPNKTDDDLSKSNNSTTHKLQQARLDKRSADNMTFSPKSNHKSQTNNSTQKLRSQNSMPMNSENKRYPGLGKSDHPSSKTIGEFGQMSEDEFRKLMNNYDMSALQYKEYLDGEEQYKQKYHMDSLMRKIVSEDELKKSADGPIQYIGENEKIESNAQKRAGDESFDENYQFATLDQENSALTQKLPVQKSERAMPNRPPLFKTKTQMGFSKLFDDLGVRSYLKEKTGSVGNLAPPKNSSQKKSLRRTSDKNLYKPAPDAGKNLNAMTSKSSGRGPGGIVFSPTDNNKDTFLSTGQNFASNQDLNFADEVKIKPPLKGMKSKTQSTNNMASHYYNQPQKLTDKSQGASCENFPTEIPTSYGQKKESYGHLVDAQHPYYNYNNNNAPTGTTKNLIGPKNNKLSSQVIDTNSVEKKTVSKRN
jgi:hypothetical protein